MLRHIGFLSLIVCLTAPSASSLVAQNPTCKAYPAGGHPIVLEDGSRLLIEPQSVSVTGKELVIAGDPSYLWRPTPTGWEYRPDSVIAVIVDSMGRGRSLRAPVGPRRFQGVRATPIGGGRIALLFAEVTPRTPPGDRDVIHGLWFGVHDGRRWTTMQRLPAVSGQVDPNSTSRLIRRRSGRLVFAIPFEAGSVAAVAVFEGDSSGWALEKISTRVSMYTAMAEEESGRLLLVSVHAHTNRIGPGNSAWLYTREPGASGWTAPQLLADARSNPVQHPELTVGSEGTRLVWDYQGGTEGSVMSIRDTSHVLRYGAGALQYFAGFARPLSRVYAAWYLMKDKRLMRLWEETSPGALRPFADLPLPIDGPIGTAQDGSSMLITGPVRGDAREPGVSTWLYRVALSCE